MITMMAMVGNPPAKVWSPQESMRQLTMGRSQWIVCCCKETTQYKTDKVVDELVIRKGAVSALGKILAPWSENTKPAN